VLDADRRRKRDFCTPAGIENKMYERD
jgi:hypothetical protein